MSQDTSSEDKDSFSCQVKVEEDKISHHADSKTHTQFDPHTVSHPPPRPPNEEKKHWSTTEDGALVARATAHVYRAIIASQQQGGMRDFLEEKCGLFLDICGVSERYGEGQSGLLTLGCSRLFISSLSGVDLSITVIFYYRNNLWSAR